MRQKAINLDQAKILALFPSLAGMPNGTKIPVQVDWFFDQAEPVRTVQTLGLSKKNWRLNSMPWVENDADENDIVVCQIVGNEGALTQRVPSSIVLALLRPNQPGYDWFETYVPRVEPGERAGFVEVPDVDLLDAARSGALGSPGPVTLLIDHLTGGLVNEIAEIASDSDVREVRRVALSDLDRTGTTRESLERLNRLNAAIGLGGEALAYAELVRRATRGEIGHPIWVSLRDAKARVDIVYPEIGDGGHLVGVEVKTTKGAHGNAFYISSAELRAVTEFERYEVWRISDLSVDEEGEVRGTVHTAALDAVASDALEWLATSPTGVIATALKVEPSIVEWSVPFQLSVDSGDVPGGDWLEGLAL